LPKKNQGFSTGVSVILLLLAIALLAGAIIAGIIMAGSLGVTR
jgi:hypothetical protein